MNKNYPFPANDGFCAANGSETAQPLVFGDVQRPWMQTPAANSIKPTVNANQLTSLNAMIAYVSYQFGQNEFSIERDLADRFKIPNTKCLPESEFENAIRYLADMLPA